MNTISVNSANNETVRAYVLATAAYNEENYIEKTILSVIHQTVLPQKWVIVSDGSTDRTDEIVRQYAAQHPFIQLYRITEDHPRNLTAQVNAINAGFSFLHGTSHQFIGNLDSDVSFEPTYFERLLEEFASAPKLGLAGGYIYEEQKGRFQNRRSNTITSVAHAVQLFRRECLELLGGGYKPFTWAGADWHAEVSLRMSGWQARSFPELHVFHHRPTGDGFGRLRYLYRGGVMDFYLGTHPLFEAFRLARRIPSKPYLFGALVRLGAFAWCYCKGEKRQVPAEFVKFLRTEQMDRLRRYCPWPSSAAGRKQVSSQGMRFRESKLKRGVQLSISLLFFPLSSLARMLATIGGKYAAPGCVVLYYHAVPETQREAFARQMDVLLKWTTPISLVSAPTLSPAVRYSAITFDDFFQNVVSNALPELKKRTIPATIFVTTEVLGKRADWWPESAPERKEEIGSLEELQGLPPDLIAIGSHTLTHPKLPLLNERDAHREIFTSRQILEEWLGRKIATLSFPFGAFNDELVEWCRQARYERVFTTLPTMAFQHPGEFVTGRVKADPTDWPLEFKLKLLGAYRWLPYAFALKRRILGFPIANHRGGSNFRG